MQDGAQIPIVLFQLRPRGSVIALDEFGYHAAENVVTVPDFHATILHLLGLDHERLIFRHDTRDEKLTDVHKAKVVKPILA